MWAISLSSPPPSGRGALPRWRRERGGGGLFPPSFFFSLFPLGGSPGEVRFSLVPTVRFFFFFFLFFPPCGFRWPLQPIGRTRPPGKEGERSAAACSFLLPFPFPSFFFFFTSPNSPPRGRRAMIEQTGGRKTRIPSDALFFLSFLFLFLLSTPSDKMTPGEGTEYPFPASTASIDEAPARCSWRPLLLPFFPFFFFLFPPLLFRAFRISSIASVVVNHGEEASERPSRTMKP